MSPAIIAVSGFTSNSGKTTVACEILKRLRGWEAIKMTRGHYRSCGKDPHACCVSDLLGEEPLIRSGHEGTYAPGKDTGRYWDAGAANVHWAVVTDRQVENGIRQALSRVEGPGVVIEGNSFLDYVEADFVVVVARGDSTKIKPSARRALSKASALYLYEEGASALPESIAEKVELLKERTGLRELPPGLRSFTSETLPQLVSMIVESISGEPVGVRVWSQKPR